MVELTDLYPTICSVIGLAQPPHVQGTDLKLVTSEFETAHERLTFSKFHGGETLTTKRFSYTEYRHKVSDKFLASMLFDLAVDPNENDNVTDSSTYASIKADLSFQLDSLRILSRK